MRSFKLVAEVLLERAARQFSEGKYAACVLTLREAAESVLKARLAAAGRGTELKSLSDAARELASVGALSDEEFKAVTLLNDLASKVRAEGYSPNRSEVLSLVTMVGKVVRKALRS